MAAPLTRFEQLQQAWSSSTVYAQEQFSETVKYVQELVKPYFDRANDNQEFYYNKVREYLPQQALNTLDATTPGHLVAGISFTTAAGVGFVGARELTRSGHLLHAEWKNDQRTRASLCARATHTVGALVFLSTSYYFAQMGIGALSE